MLLALEKGAKNATSIAASLSCAGIIVGISGLTRFRIKVYYDYTKHIWGGGT